MKSNSKSNIKKIIKKYIILYKLKIRVLFVFLLFIQIFNFFQFIFDCSFTSARVKSAGNTLISMIQLHKSVCEKVIKKTKKKKKIKLLLVSWQFLRHSTFFLICIFFQTNTCSVNNNLVDS